MSSPATSAPACNWANWCGSPGRGSSECIMRRGGSCGWRDIACREHVDRREPCATDEAIVEVDRKAEVARPQRMTHLRVAFGVRFELRDRVHRERACARQPPGVARTLMELQERIPVAGGAVAQVRSLAPG